MLPISRRCARCSETRPIEQFPAKMSRRSGFGGVCIECDPPDPAGPVVTAGMSERTIRRMCKTKRRLSSRHAAERAQVAHALKHRGQRVRWYHCPVCDGYHLTTKEKIDDEA